MQRLLFYLILLPAVFFVLFYNQPEEDEVEFQTHSGDMIRVMGKTYVPFPLLDKSFKLLSYDEKNDQLSKDGSTYKGQYVGHLTDKNKIYLLTYSAISEHPLGKDGSIGKRIKFLPTPRCEFITSCFLKNKLMTVVTYGSSKLKVISWVDQQWEVQEEISLSKKQVPRGRVFISNNNDHFVALWESAKAIYLVNLFQDKPVIRKLPDEGLSNIALWENQEETFISGFGIDDVDLKTYKVDGIFSNHQILTKFDVGAYPTFKYPSRLNSLTPIITHNEVKGFFFGSSFDVPIYISKESPLTQEDLDHLVYDELMEKIPSGIIVLMTFLLLTMLSVYKGAMVWEDKLVALKIPMKAIFFGPTIHRGFAYLIDMLIYLVVLGVIVYLFPTFISVPSLLSAVQTNDSISNYTDNLDVVIKMYFLMFTYFTFFDYFYAGSIGKMCTGLKIVSNKDLKKINLLQAVSRNILPKELGSFILVLISNVLITITKKKRSLYDYLGNTVVVYARLHKKLNIKIEINTNDTDDSDIK